MQNNYHGCRANMAAAIFPSTDNVSLMPVVNTHDVASQCEIEDRCDQEPRKSFHFFMKRTLTTRHHPDKPPSF
jgi:hypothetical protein